MNWRQVTHFSCQLILSINFYIDYHCRREIIIKYTRHDFVVLTTVYCSVDELIRQDKRIAPDGILYESHIPYLVNVKLHLD